MANGNDDTAGDHGGDELPAPRPFWRKGYEPDISSCRALESLKGHDFRRPLQFPGVGAAVAFAGAEKRPFQMVAANGLGNHRIGGAQFFHPRELATKCIDFIGDQGYEETVSLVPAQGLNRVPQCFGAQLLLLKIDTREAVHLKIKKRTGRHRAGSILNRWPQLRETAIRALRISLPTCLLLFAATCTPVSNARAGAPKKIVLIAGTKSHGPGEHEYEQGIRLMERCLLSARNIPKVAPVVVLDGWPDDRMVFEGAATIVLYCDGADRDEAAHPLLRGNHLSEISAMMNRGVGLVALHYAVIVPKTRGGDEFLRWIGGYFDYETGPPPKRWYSAIDTREFHAIPARPGHPILRGVRPFNVREEFYYHVRFPEERTGWSPILRLAPEQAGDEQVVAYAIERPDGGRGFGYTGGHFHSNWANEHVRMLILNGILWTAGVDVPESGAESSLPP